MNIASLKRQAVSPSQSTSQAGAAAVEFAFVLVIMLLIMAGMVEFGRTFWYADALTKATRDGARLLSNWPIVDINNGVTKAQDLTINSANAANVRPQLLPGDVNVTVECLDSLFNPITVGCSSGTKPANVRVSITGFTVNLGEWFPFIGTDGLITLGDIPLAPHTTMRYMN